MKQIVSSKWFVFGSAALIAFIVGAELDRRILRDDQPQRYAMVKPEMFGTSEHEQAVRERIEQASGAKDTVLLSSEEWIPAERVVIEGIDVSDLFAGEFLLKRSAEPGFVFKGGVLEAGFERPGTFLDLAVSSNDGARLITRFSAEGVRAFKRSSSGELQSISPPMKMNPKGCARFDISSTASEQSVVCQGITVLQISPAKEYTGKVFVTSNLKRSEIKELSIFK